jgi:hemin uptake protein HemP
VEHLKENRTYICVRCCWTCNVVANHYHLRMTVSWIRPPPEAEFLSPVEGVRSRGSAIPLVRSEELFGKTREILIAHGGAYYRLRVTHSNKLILTK